MELNKPYFVKRVANKDGVLHYLPVEGFCYGVEMNKPYMAKRVASKDGVLHYLLADQKLDDGKLILNKPYFAKRVANKDGTLHYLINGKKCCLCDGVTSDVTSTLFSAAIIHEMPLLYRDDIRETSLDLPDEMYDPSLGPIPGWLGYLGLGGGFGDQQIWCTGEYFTFPSYSFYIIVRRCDMKIWLVQNYATGIGTGWRNMFTICNDPDDIIQCDPFNVVRKMDLVNPIPWTQGYAPEHPFTGCTEEGSDCTGEDYIQLTIP